MRHLRRIGALAVMASVACVPAAQDANRDVLVRDRYLSTAMENPRRGTVIEKLYQLAVQTDGVDALVQKIQGMTDKGSPASRWTLIGLIEDVRGNDDKAIAAFDRATQADPKKYYAWYTRGVLLLHRNDYKGGADSLLRALEADPSRDDAIDIRKALGRCYLRSRQTDKAKATWSALAQLAPNDSVTLEELTSLLVEEEQWDEALKYYEQLARLQKDRPYQAVLCTIAVAGIEARRGRFDAALANYEAALSRTDPDGWLATDIRSRVQDLFRKRNDLAGLVTYYEGRLKGKDSQDVRTMAALARLLTELDRSKDARQWYERALGLAPKDEAIRLAYVRLLDQLKDYPAAITQYEQLLEAKPKEASYLEALGDLILKQAKDAAAQDKARKLWNRIAESNPTDAATQIQVGGIFGEHGMGDDAERCYKRAIELAPNVGQYREYYGEFLVKVRQRDKALAVLRDMASDTRRSVDTLMRLADVLKHFQFQEESLASCREAVELKPDHFAARRQLVAFLTERQQYDEALKELDTAAALAPNPFFKGEIVDDRIRLLNRAGKLKEVFDSRMQSLAQSAPTDALPYVECAKMAVALGRTEDANTLVNKALALAPNAVAAWELAARVYRQGSDAERQAKALRRLVELAPQNRVEYLRQLAQLHGQLGESGDAVRAAEEMIAASPDSPAGYEVLAGLCERFGMADRSLAVLSKAVRINPKDLELRMLYARRLERGGEPDQALEQYWQAFESQEDTEDRLSIVKTMAEVCYRAGKFEAFIERLKRRGRVNQDDWVTSLCVATAYRQIEDFTKAREALSSWQGKRPDDAQLLKQLVQLSESEGLKERALEYLRKLVKLEPSRDNHLRMGELLFDLGRKDEAIDTWRRAVDSGSDRAATLSMVSERLLNHQMGEAAVTLMGDTFEKHPDDWALGYRYGLGMMGAERLDEAAKVFLRIADMPDLPPTIAPAPKPKAGSSPAASHAMSYWANMPPEVVRAQKVFSLRYQLSSRYRGGSGPQVAFMPPDLETARLAAWYQYGQIARKQGRFDALVAALKKENTPRALWRLIETHATQEEWTQNISDAAKALCAMAPKDVSARIVLLYSIAYRQGGKGASANYEEVKKLVDDTVRNRPDLGMHVTSMWMSYLQQTGKMEDLSAYAKTLAQQDHKDVQSIMTAMRAATVAKDTDTAMKLLEKAEQQFGQNTLQASPYSQAIAQMGLGVAQLLTARNDSARGDAESAAKLFAKTLRQTRPASVSSQYVDTSYYSYSQGTMVTGDAFPNANAYYDGRRMMMLESFYRGERDARRTSRVVVSGGKVRTGATSGPSTDETSKAGGSTEHPAVACLRSLLQKDLSSTNVDDQIYAHMAFACFDWWGDRRDEAAKHIGSVVTLRPWDVSLRLTLARIRYNLDDKRGTIEALSSFQQRYHPLYKPAQQLLLKAARSVGDTEAARAAALRLFNMRLPAGEELELAAAMHELGLSGKAEQLEQRVKTLSQNDFHQLVQLMQKQQSRGAKKEAAALAKQVLRQMTNATTNEEYIRDSALRVLKDSGDLDELIASTEKQLASNPNSVRVLTDLWNYYMAKGDAAKATARAEQVLNLRPNDMGLRMQYAISLCRNQKNDAAMKQFRIILDKEPSALFGNNMYQVLNAFRNAKRLDEFTQLIAKADWDKIAQSLPQNYPQQFIQNLTEIARQLQWDREVAGDVMPYLDKLNDYVLASSQQEWTLPQVVEIRYSILVKKGRKWEAFRYALAFTQTFNGFVAKAPASVPTEQADRPLGVKTQTFDPMSKVQGYSHPDGSPNGLVLFLLTGAEEYGQLEPMRAHVAKKLADAPSDLGTAFWLAVLNARLGRTEEVRAAVPKLLERHSETGGECAPVLWLDEAIKKDEKLRGESVLCCEYMLAQDKNRQHGSGLTSLFMCRLAGRYVLNGQVEQGRAVFLQMAKLDPPSHYTGQSAESERIRYMLYAAEGLEKAGLYTDAYTVAADTVKRLASADSRTYEVEQANRLLKRLAEQYPEAGSALSIAACPISESAYQVVWSMPSSGMTVDAGQDAQAAVVEAQPGVFTGYQAEIQVAASPKGPFRRVAVTEASAQQYRHSDVPPNKLLCVRVVLRDSDNRIAAISDSTPVAVGKNLIGDGGMESLTDGPVPETLPDGKHPWLPCDLENKPVAGFVSVQGRRPFSGGSRLIAGNIAGQPKFAGTPPIPIDRKKHYLIGGWVHTSGAGAGLGRVSLDKDQKPLVIGESFSVSGGPHWAFGSQRLSPGSIATASGGAPPRGKTAAMPAEQASVRIGFQLLGEGAFDDAFLIEYTPADDALIASLPKADDAKLDAKASKGFGTTVAARRPAHMLAAVPVSENSIQLIWSTQPRSLDGLTGNTTVAVRIVDEKRAFEPYTAEIQVATREKGDYHVLAKVPASSQTCVHENAPPNVLFWYRLVLRDAKGGVRTTSLAIASATGKNLIPNPGLEQGPFPRFVLGPRDSSVTWQVLDLGSDAQDALGLADAARPFSKGHKCLAKGKGGEVVTTQPAAPPPLDPLGQLVAKSGDLSGSTFFATRPFPVDPAKTYLFGAWLRAEQEAITMGRVALFNESVPLLVSETVTHRPQFSKDWICVTQRLEPCADLKPKPSLSPRIQKAKEASNQMPSNQKAVMMGFALWTKSAVDDVFLIEYRPAEESVLKSLPRPDKPEGDTAAARGN